MKKLVFFVVLLSLILTAPSGCDKYEISNLSRDKVEFFLIKSYKRVDYTQAIDENSIELDRIPLVNYSDILSYSASNHYFRFSDRGVKAVKGVEQSVNGVPFALVADGELIYTGYFWPSFSSASCEWITIDPLLIYSNNRMMVHLGYPGDFEGVPDRRNDQRLLNILRRDDKLELGQ